MKMTSRTLSPLTLATAAMALATPVLNAVDYNAPSGPDVSFIEQSNAYDNMTIQNSSVGITGAGVVVTVSGNVLVNGKSLVLSAGASLDVAGTLNVGQSGTSILSAFTGSSISAAALVQGGLSQVSAAAGSLVVGTYTISGASPGSELVIIGGGTVTVTDFYWDTLNLRFATSSAGKLIFDNSHGNMGTVSLAIGGSVIATEGLVYTIVESPIGGITGTFNNLPEGAILAGMTTGQEFTVHYTPYEITLTAGAPIPEPSTYALLGGVGAVALVLASRWRRRQR